MRTREEVLAEINWREKEIEEFRNNPSSDNKTAELNRWRYTNMCYAVTWLKWFLNEEKV